jgi:hypothetical protein
VFSDAIVPGIVVSSHCPFVLEDARPSQRILSSEWLTLDMIKTSGVHPKQRSPSASEH